DGMGTSCLIGTAHCRPLRLFHSSPGGRRAAGRQHVALGVRRSGLTGPRKMHDTAEMTARAARLAALVLAAALPACGRLREEPSPSPIPSSGPHCGNYGHRITTLKSQGGRVDWSRSTGLIAYDRPGANGPYFDVYVMAADGTGENCLTCGRAGVPQRNNGNPAWHPSGNYIAFQSEVASSNAS